jgi:hypothetical protein
MRRPQQPAMPPLQNYAPEIDLLHCRLSTLALRWQGVALAPPYVAEAMEELATGVEELHTMNEDLTQSQQAALETQQRYQELFEGVPETYLVTDLRRGRLRTPLGPRTDRAAAGDHHLWT